MRLAESWAGIAVGSLAGCLTCGGPTGSPLFADELIPEHLGSTAVISRRVSSVSDGRSSRG